LYCYPIGEWSAAEAQIKMTKMHGGTDVTGLHRQGAHGHSAAPGGQQNTGIG